MKSPVVATCLTLAVAWGAAGEARAQLFGERTLGGPISARPRPGVREEASVDPRARFLRGNREETDFVGADSRDTPAFVGTQSGTTTGQVRSAVTNLRIETTANANRYQQATPRTGMYRPRLRVAFAFPALSSREVTANLAYQLEISLAHRFKAAFPTARLPRIEVTVDQQKATLRGAVLSDREKTLAGLLVQFEPGISEVQNDLIVGQPPAALRPPSGPAPPMAPRPVQRN